RSPWIDTNAANVIDGGKGVAIDQATVAPGETFSCTIPVRALDHYATSTEYFTPVTEGKAWLPEADTVSAALATADPDHVPWSGGDYAAGYVSESYPTNVLRPGETATVTLHFRNTGAATLYNSGTNPTRCRAS